MEVSPPLSGHLFGMLRQALDSLSQGYFEESPVYMLPLQQIYLDLS